MDEASFSEQYQNYLCGELSLSPNESLSLRWRRVAFLSFAFVIFVVGVPIWWLTTTPYRASLAVLDPTEYETALEKHFSAPSSAENGGDVWHSLRPQSEYSVHFVFVHQKATRNSIEFSRSIERKLGNFAQEHFRGIGVEVLLSAEHLFDFSLSPFVSSSPLRPLPIDSSDQQLPASLCSELDRLMGSAPLGKESLLKLAVFLPPFDGRTQTEIRLTQNGLPTVGLAVASWGGLFIPPQSVNGNADSVALLNAILSVLHLQFAIVRPPPNEGEETAQQMLNKTLIEHKKRLVIENLVQTLRTLNALHKLAENIADLVIPDEVARLSMESKALFLRAFIALNERNHFDSASASEARRLAEKANSDPSLLELLNFPSEQKYGVYVPLFLPLLVPLLQPVALFAMFLLSKHKKRRQKLAEEKAKSE
ncbi:hypothetical protein niasHT_003934 [Heterodera trifolii]|uniref:GPI transamidase component PIG-S n=1 Tax=Heterodera trifolii TaxID=157864 RepID=A0ABD2LV71_9BILA